jgi:hypothetical protein
VIITAADSEVRSITIQSSGSDAYSTAVYVGPTSLGSTLTQVTMLGKGSDNATGLRVNAADPFVRNCVLSARDSISYAYALESRSNASGVYRASDFSVDASLSTSGGLAIGAFVFTGSTPEFDSCTFQVREAGMGKAFGLYADSASPVLTGCSMDVRGSTQAAIIRQSGPSGSEIDGLNGKVRTDGGSAIGVHVDGGNLGITGSSLVVTNTTGSGSSYGILNANAKVVLTRSDVVSKGSATSRGVSSTGATSLTEIEFSTLKAEDEGFVSADGTYFVANTRLDAPVPSTTGTGITTCIYVYNGLFTPLSTTCN